MKILIADDTQEERFYLKNILEIAGYQADETSNGRQGWEAWQKDRYDVVISDWKMPEMTGIELVENIRKHPRDHYTYVILITAFNEADRLVQALEAGADDFMSKPLRLAEARARLGVAERILRLQGHLRKLEGILSICAYCKDIRQGQDWSRLDHYIESQTDVQFSHSICPTCMKRVLPEARRIAEGRK